MDSFEVRVQFTSRLSKLGASRDSILKVANFAMEHLEHSEDLFNCIVEQLKSTSVKYRLNLLCLIDTLCQISVSSCSIGTSVYTIEPSLINSSISAGKKVKPEVGELSPENRATDEVALKRKLPLKDTTSTEVSGSGLDSDKHSNPTTTNDSKGSLGTNSLNPFPKLVKTYMSQLFEYAVPKDSKGALNLSGARKILSSWRSKNLFPVELIDATEQSLKNHQFEESNGPGFSRSEIFRRIEEDRERHKRMKEENWIQPSEASERREFEELYDCLEQPSLESLLDTLDQLHVQFLYDTTSLGNC